MFFIKINIESFHDAVNSNNTEMIYILLNKAQIIDTCSIFTNSYSLKQIVIPPSIIQIGINSFYNCTKLMQVSIPSSVTAIKKYSFYNCISLKKISIPSSCVSIEEGAFCKCISLVRIKIPSSVTMIGDYAFSECKSLKKIIIPSSVVWLGGYAFCYCNSLTQIFLYSSITIINDYTFNECFSLKQIIIPSSVTSIGKFAFQGCSSLTDVLLPHYLSFIGESAFQGCSSLTEILIPPSVQSIDRLAFFKCSSLSQASIPTSMKSIGEHVFKNCNLLKDNDSGFDIFIEMDDTPKRIIFLILYFLGTPFFCIVVEFIISLIWWSRIHPWFAHGFKSGKIVYYFLLTCWISSLLIFFGILNFILYITKRKKILKKIILKKKRYLFRGCCNVIIFLSLSAIYCLPLIVIASAFVASIYALKSETIDGKPIKCMKYIFNGYEGAKVWVANQSLVKQKRFDEWYLKMKSKAYGTHGTITNYYCIEIGIPSLIFAILPFGVYIIQLFIIIFSRKILPCDEY